jgi:hypothetical protein
VLPDLGPVGRHGSVVLLDRGLQLPNGGEGSLVVTPPRVVVLLELCVVGLPSLVFLLHRGRVLGPHEPGNGNGDDGDGGEPARVLHGVFSSMQNADFRGATRALPVREGDWAAASG